MTKISNTTAYKIKSPLSLNDFAVGTNNESNVSGFAKGQTISMGLAELRDLFLSGLSPETGGTLKITEIEIANLDTDVATTVNAIDPPYEIERYELVFFNIEGQIFLCKKTNQTIGDGETALTNDDFIEFPVSVGPAGTNGTNGSVWRNGSGAPSNSLGANGDYYLNTTNSDVYLKSTGTYSIVTNIKGATGNNGANGKGITSITKTGTSGLADTYTITYTDASTTTFTVTNGADGNFVNVQDLTKTTSFILQSTDNKKTLFVENGASDITITVPSGLPSAFYAVIVRKGSGNITFATSGTTIYNPTGMKIDMRYDLVVIEQEGATNVFGLFGNTKA